MIRAALLVLAVALASQAAEPPPVAVPPYYSVRYEASEVPGELGVAVTHTLWIPPGVKALRGVILHQHGCGISSGISGLTAAYDLNWQALAKK
ncbi:MAG: GDSL-like Lipase/Acylhydrolase, partial [Verrucomicrobiaceae bacterium]|nr:GDSL-like Lipase/Acylhydrolase [Verrucomicrobiaceae bacterium]